MKKKSQQPLVVLDFDGVVCDSVDECFLVGFNAFQRMIGRERISRPEESPAELRSYFRQHRGFVRPAGEYFILFDDFYNGSRSLSADRFHQAWYEKKDRIQEYERNFFAERDAIKKTNRELWNQLNPFFPGVVSGLVQLMQKHPVVILTTKDTASVEQLLSKNGVSGLLTYGKEELSRAGSKTKALIKIMKERATSPQNLHYLDDHEDYLREAARLEVHCYWAAWGYSQTPRTKTIRVCRDFSEFCRLILHTNS